MNNDTHPARERMKNAMKVIPSSLFQDLEDIRQHVANKLHPSIYITAALMYAMIKSGMSEKDKQFLDNLKSADLSLLIDPLATVAAWRMTQGIYRFDPDVYETVINTKMEGNIPTDILLRIPEWCIYIETPGLTVPALDFKQISVHGTWVRIDQQQDSFYLIMGLNPLQETNTVEIEHGYLHLKGTLDEALDALMKENKADTYMKNAVKGYVQTILNLLLYICSENADITGKRVKPSNPEPVKTKRGIKTFPASAPTTWDVGVRMGTALRQAYAVEAERNVSTDAHVGPRPHIRRAHWHGFRSGPMLASDGTKIPIDKRQFNLKWLPPIAVNLQEIEQLPSTIRPLK